MTETSVPAAEPVVAEAPDPAPKARRVRAPVSPALAIYGAALSIVAVLLLGFLVDLTFVGALHQNRDQKIAYADLRLALANGVAPVGPTDYNGVLLAPGTPVALLEVPQLGLKEVVLEGTTSGVLMRGAGHLRTSALPGQAGISEVMGRRAAYGGPFGGISGLRPGAKIIVTSGLGTSTFAVMDVRRGHDPNPPLVEGASRLVLVTAAGPPLRPTGVVRVDAKLTSQEFDSGPVPAGIPRLAGSERALHGDSSALFVLVLWAQALLIAAVAVAWARLRWGRWETWIVGLPLLIVLGVTVADRAAQLLPNLM